MRLEEERRVAALAEAQSLRDEGAMSEAARRWHLSNNVEITSDAYWAPNTEHMNAARKTHRWRDDENFFKSVKVSAIAAVKMLIHAKRGMPQEGRENWFEVMGLMMGHYRGDVMYVTDSFGLPVDASEVECSMNENSMIYQAEYMNYHRRIGKPDNGCIGWYHTHPGYTCFLSGIDVNTQQQSQAIQDPWVAIVIDPVGTIATGKMDIKAFRTYTNAYVEGKGETSVSPELVKKKGVHAHKYYELPITLVRSRTDAVQLDALLGQYWALTFSTNPLIANRVFHTQQVQDVATVVGEACGHDCHGRHAGHRRRRRTETAATADPRMQQERTAPAEKPAPMVLDVQWGLSQRSVAEGVSEKKPVVDLAGVQGPVENRAIQQSSDLATEILLGGVQLSLKHKVFNPFPLAE